MPPPLRFTSKVRKSTSGCWHWTGRVDPVTGYGSFSVGSRSDGTRATRGPHVVAYEYDHGVTIPPRGAPGHFQVDHECHNRSRSCPGGPACLHRRCVNPTHLVARSPKGNGAASARSTASVNRAKTHCGRCGDDLSDAYISNRGSRQCRRCAKRRRRESRERAAPC